MNQTTQRMPRDYRKEIGRSGEDLAVLLLMQKGFRIIRRNFTCRLGEIDIVAEKNGLLSFVEVKTRLSASYGPGRNAVNRQKCRHMRAAAQVFLENTVIPYREMEFAVIEISAEHLSGLAI